MNVIELKTFHRMKRADLSQKTLIIMMNPTEVKDQTLSQITLIVMLISPNPNHMRILPCNPSVTFPSSSIASHSPHIRLSPFLLCFPFLLLSSAPPLFPPIHVFPSFPFLQTTQAPSTTEPTNPRSLPPTAPADTKGPAQVLAGLETSTTHGKPPGSLGIARHSFSSDQ